MSQKEEELKRKLREIQEELSGMLEHGAVEQSQFYNKSKKLLLDNEIIGDPQYSIRITNAIMHHIPAGERTGLKNDYVCTPFSLIPTSEIGKDIDAYVTIKESAMEFVEGRIERDSTILETDFNEMIQSYLGQQEKIESLQEDRREHVISSIIFSVKKELFAERGITIISDKAYKQNSQIVGQYGTLGHLENVIKRLHAAGHM